MFKKPNELEIFKKKVIETNVQLDALDEKIEKLHYEKESAELQLSTYAQLTIDLAELVIEEQEELIRAAKSYI